MPFPLTNEFVAKLCNQPVKSFEVSAGSNAGEGVAGQLQSIKVTTTNGDVLSLVHKTFPDDPAQQAFTAKSGSFRIEHTFYSELAPKLELLIKSMNIADTSLPIPKFYHGFNDDSNDYITMEDLRPQSYRIADKYKGLNIAEVSLALKQLGRFHALTYFLLRFEGEKFLKQYPLIEKSKWLEPETLQETSMMMGGINAFSIELIKKRNEELGKKMEAAFAKTPASDQMKATMLDTDKNYFPCIIHGDIWCNNILFRYENNESGGPKPVDVKFIDFQQTRRGNVFEDLQYFFFTSTTPQFRKDHLYQSLDLYYDAFTSTLAELKFPLPINFTRGFLIDNFEKCIFRAYTFMQFALPLQLGIMPPVSDMFGPPGGPGGPPQGEGQGPPPSFNPENFNPDDIPLEIRVTMFLGHLNGMMNNCPRAQDRLEDLTKEMNELGLL